MAMQNEHALSSGEVAIYAVVVVLLVLGAGLMSGLTLGLLSLDVMDLEVLRVSGSSSQRQGAARLLPLVTKPHWLLCTLLLCNAACMEALPLFLDRLLDPVGAILLSVTAILVFGEIIPQAVCSRFGVLIGAKLAPMVRLLMWFCSPITWPLGKLLDAVLGHEDPVMKRGELKAMVQLHGEGAGLGGKLTMDEVNVIHGAMDLTHKTAVGAMTPMPKVFMLSDCDVLDEKLLQQILRSGHSRVPVYRGADREDIIGLILVKEILQFWRAETTPLVGQLDIRHMPQIPADCPMFDVLRLFQTGNSHMALLLAPSGIDVDEFRRNFSWLRSNDNDSSTSSGSSSSSDGSSGSSPDSANAQLASAAGEDGVRTPNGKPQKHRNKDHKHSSNKSKSRHLSRRGSAASSLAGSLFRGGGGGDAAAAGGAEAEAGAAADAAESRSSKPFKLLRFNLSSRKSASFSRGKSSAAPSPMADQQQQQQQQQGIHEHLALEMQQLAAAGAAGGLEAGCSAEQQPQPQVPVQQQQQPQMTALGVPRFAPVGIITLEDVMEELMQHEIVDETDVFSDNEQTEKVDLEKLMSGLPPRLHALLRAEMLAAAQNFVKQSVWNPTPELNPNNIRHSTAIRVTGTLGRSMASGTAGGAGTRHEGLLQQQLAAVAAGAVSGSTGGQQGARPASAGGAPAAAAASGSGSGPGSGLAGLAALRVGGPRTPRSPLAAGAGVSPMCNALFAAAAAAPAASSGAPSAPRSPFGQHRSSAPGHLEATAASGAADAPLEATVPATRQATAPLSLGAAAAAAGIGVAGAGAASAASFKGPPTLRTFKSIKRVQSGGGLEAAADAAAAAAGLGGASSSGGGGGGTSSSQADAS